MTYSPALSPDSKKRNPSLDYAKGLSIIVVVFLHVWRGMSSAGLLKSFSTQTFLAWSSAGTIISIPAFFFVSGLLYGSTMHRRHGLREFAGKADNLFYPYVIWSLIVGLIEALGAGYSNKATEIAALYDILWEPHGIFWFLYASLASFLITEILVFLLGPARTKYASVALGVIFLLLFQPMRMPFSAPEIMKSYIYMALGMAASDFMGRFEHKKSLFAAGMPLILMGVVLYVSHIIFGVMSNSSRSVTPNATFVAIVVLALFIVACYLLPNGHFNWLSKLGQRSLEVYLIHIIIIAPLRILLQKTLGIESPGIYLAVGVSGGVLGSLALATCLRQLGAGWLFSPPEQLSFRKRLEAVSRDHV